MRSPTWYLRYARGWVCARNRNGWLRDRRADLTLGDLLRGAEVEKTCSACPAQWEGRLADGRFVYVRYRHGWLSIGLGASSDEAVERAMDDRVEFLAQLGHEGDGWLRWSEVLQAVER